MDVKEEYMTLKEKIAELEYNQIQLRDLNTEMRKWLDVADDDMAALRSENTALRKQLKVLENISPAQQSEADLCGSPLADELDVEKCNEKKILKLEKEYILMKEHNMKLTAEKYIKLKYLEETVEELSNFIRELKQMNQELRKQLEDRRDEASFFAVNDLTGEKLQCPHLSIAEEIRLLASTPTVKTNNYDYKNRREGENDEEEQLKPQSHTINLQTKRFASMLGKVIHRVRLFPLYILIFTLFAFMVTESFARNHEVFFNNTFWKVARVLLQPYCGVHYGALPPI